MDLDEFKCITKGCDKISHFESICKTRSYFCKNHYNKFKKSKKCEREIIREEIFLAKIMLTKNALDSLINKLTPLSLAEVDKINAFLSENSNFIEFIKLQIKNSSINTESTDYIISSARNYSVKNKDKRWLYLRIQYLLSINGQSEKIKNEWIEIDNEISKLPIEIEQMKRKKENLQTNYSNILEEFKNKEKLAYNKKHMEQQLLYVEIRCNLESAKFEEMNLNEKINYLIEQKYEDYAEIFEVRRYYYHFENIFMTYDTKFIFFCKF